MTFSPGGGGSGSLSGSSDVALNLPVAQQILSYDAGVAKWKNTTLPLSIVYWDADTRTWGARPSVPAGHVEYRSTNDATADAPTTALDGDVWERRV